MPRWPALAALTALTLMAPASARRPTRRSPSLRDAAREHVRAPADRAARPHAHGGRDRGAADRRREPVVGADRRERDGRAGHGRDRPSGDHVRRPLEPDPARTRCSASRTRTRPTATFTIAAGQTATVTADVTLIRTPVRRRHARRRMVASSPRRAGRSWSARPRPVPTRARWAWSSTSRSSAWPAATWSPDGGHGRRAWPRRALGLPAAQQPGRPARARTGALGRLDGEPLAARPARGVGAVRPLHGRRAHLCRQRLDLRVPGSGRLNQLTRNDGC